MQRYCPSCGQPTEYSGGIAPKFCGSCGKPLGTQAFVSTTMPATPVTSIPVPTKPIYPVVGPSKSFIRQRGQPEGEDGPEEFAGQDPYALAASFAQGIHVNAEKKKLTVGDLQDYVDPGSRRVSAVEGVDVSNRKEESYACLDPKQFVNRPSAPPLKTPRRPRGRPKK